MRDGRDELLGGILNGHLALFRIEQENRVVDDPDNPGFSLPSGRVRTQGFEAELTGSPLPGWDLTASYAYTDTEFLEGEPGQAGPFSIPERRSTTSSSGAGMISPMNERQDC